MILNDVWSNGTPIYDRLPGINGGYKNDVSQWLTIYFDENIINLNALMDNFNEQLDPETCDAKYLDYLAGLFGWSGEYWSTTYPEQTKRALLANSFSLIWPQKGSKNVLAFVITAFGIPNVIQEGDSFIIGVDEVGDELGEIAWTYRIILPSQYFKSPEEALVRKLNALFGPIWCASDIIFDDNYFGTFDIIGNTTPVPDEYGAINVNTDEDPQILSAN